MNRLILIGNGFDRMHGLKTSYSDIIKHYFRSVKDAIKADVKRTFDDGLITIKSNNIGFSLDLIPSNILSEKFDNINQETFQSLKKNGITSSPSQNLATFEPGELIDSIFNNDSGLWADVEHSFYKLLVQSTQNKLSIGRLNAQMAKFESVLIEYLKKETLTNNRIRKEVLDLLTINQSEFLTEFDKTRIKDNGSQLDKISRLLLLSFNYTNTCDLYYHELLESKRITKVDLIKIHGDLNNPINNPIIFGYGDEKDENYKLIENQNNSKHLEYIKSMKYFLSDNYKRLINFIEPGDYEIFVIGHSCGLSDKTLLSYLFEHKNCKAIYPFYHEDESMYFEKVKEISRQFDNKIDLRLKIINLTESNKALFKLPE